MAMSLSAHFISINDVVVDNLYGAQKLWFFIHKTKLFFFNQRSKQILILSHAGYYFLSENIVQSSPS